MSKPCVTCGGLERYENGGRCKACVRRRARTWRSKNPSAKKEYDKDYNSKNRVKRLSYKRWYRVAKADQVKESKNLWRLANKERVRLYAKRTYQKNKTKWCEKSILSSKRWQAKNPDYHKKYRIANLDKFAAYRRRSRRRRQLLINLGQLTVLQHKIIMDKPTWCIIILLTRT